MGNHHANKVSGGNTIAGSVLLAILEQALAGPLEADGLTMAERLDATVRTRVRLLGEGYTEALLHVCEERPEIHRAYLAESDNPDSPEAKRRVKLLSERAAGDRAERVAAADVRITPTTRFLSAVGKAMDDSEKEGAKLCFADAANLVAETQPALYKEYLAEVNS